MPQESSNRASTWDNRGVIAGGAIVAVIVVWALLGFYASRRENPGTFGDMFGAASALFSGLAFAGLVYTIALQRHELTSQKEDLAETRRELRLQTKHFEDQNRFMSQQGLENTFFQLLRLHNDIVNAIDLRSRRQSEEIARGKDCFKVFFNDLKSKYEGHKRISPEASQHQLLLAAYEDFFELHQSDVGHYFRSLYNMVKFVHNSSLPDKRLYTNLIRAQLSSYEQVMLLYNCISRLGSEKFKPLVEEYGLFKNLPIGLLLEEQDKMFFAARAFA